LRGLGADVLRTNEAGMAGSSDEAQLDFTTQEGRTLYTANLADFAQLHSQWSKAERLHAGIIVRTQFIPTPAQVAAFASILNAFVQTQLRGQFLYLSNWVPKDA
jgi:hypothetical protein